MRFSEISDSTLFGLEDYWQTPSEVLMRREGDNEDWTNTLVSAISYYKPSAKCYVLAIESHLTSFCYLGNGQINWVDQYETSYSRTFSASDTEEEKEAKVNEIYKMYAKRYRLRAGVEMRVLFAYNDKDFVEFANNQEFFDWAVALDS
jgi:hypothetical protein